MCACVHVGERLRVFVLCVCVCVCVCVLCLCARARVCARLSKNNHHTIQPKQKLFLHFSFVVHAKSVRARACVHRKYFIFVFFGAHYALRGTAL